MGKRWSSWTARILVGILAGSFFLFLGIPLAALIIREPPGIVVEPDQATRGFTGIAVKYCHHFCKFIFDYSIRATCGVCSGTHAYSWPQIPTNAGHDAHSSSTCCSWSSIADYFWAFWTDRSIPHPAGN